MRADLMLSPLDSILPQDILSRYSEWIYFFLVLIFFIAVAGIALRKHFERPYVRPLIVVVGILLALAVFRQRQVLALIFEGWGTLGTILLVLLVAVIPFGLARGFGLPSSRAFWLTYALFYILSWMHFPALFDSLSNQNLGFINIILLILFIISLWQVLRFKLKSGKVGGQKPDSWAAENRFKPEFEEEDQIESAEIRALKKEAIPVTIKELRSIKDIEESLLHCQELIQRRHQSLDREDREKLASLVQSILGNESVLKRGAERLRKDFQRLAAVDHDQLKEKKNRLQQVEGREKDILKAEIKREEERAKIEVAINEYNSRLDIIIGEFDRQLGIVIEMLRNSRYPGDALPFIASAREVLRDIQMVTASMKNLEKRADATIREERELLAKERKAA